MPNPNGGLFTAICAMPCGAYSATYVSLDCAACMEYYGCNASGSYAGVLSATEVKARCDEMAANSSFGVNIAETYPSAASDMADLGWRAGESYSFDKSQGNGAMALQEIAMIGYRRCLDHGVCIPCPASTYSQPIGEDNGSQLIFLIYVNECPNGGLSDENNNYFIKSCYMNGPFSDDTGRGEYTDKCYYVPD